MRTKREPTPLPEPAPDAVTRWEAHRADCDVCPDGFCLTGIDLQTEAERLQEMNRD